MALALYSFPHIDHKLSTLGELYRPFTVTFDGLRGGAFDQQIYIHNDDINRWYGDIVVQAIDTAGINITNNSSAGYYWKFAQKDVPLTLEEWELITPGNTLTISTSIGSSSAGDAASYIGFWVRVAIPGGQSIQVIKDVKLRLSATEYLV